MSRLRLAEAKHGAQQAGHRHAARAHMDESPAIRAPRGGDRHSGTTLQRIRHHDRRQLLPIRRHRRGRGRRLQRARHRTHPQPVHRHRSRRERRHRQRHRTRQPRSGAQRRAHVHRHRPDRRRDRRHHRRIARRTASRHAQRDRRRVPPGARIPAHLPHRHARHPAIQFRNSHLPQHRRHPGSARRTRHFRRAQRDHGTDFRRTVPLGCFGRRDGHSHRERRQLHDSAVSTGSY